MDVANNWKDYEILDMASGEKFIYDIDVIKQLGYKIAWRNLIANRN